MELLEKNFDIAFSAPEGITKLRELILILAMRGKLVPQNPDVEPARELLKKIEKQRSQLIKDGKLKRSDPLPEIKVDEIPYELPEGWEWVRLGAVLVFEYGSNLPAHRRSGSGEFPVFGSNGIVGTHNEALLTSPCIIIGRKGSAGALNLSNFTGAFITDVAYYCKPPDCVSLYFIFYLLHSLNLSKLGKGIKPGLNRNEVYLLKIPLPPLEEQKRIVKKIEELCALCEQLEGLKYQKQQLCDSLQSVASYKLLSGEAFDKTFEFVTKNFSELYSKKEHIKNLQDVILELAMRGKLVPQDPHLEPAKELLKKIEKERLELIKDGKLKKSDPLSEIKVDEIPYELPEGWEWVRLGSLGQIYNGNSLNDSQKSIFSSTQVSDFLPYLSTKDIGYRSELECLSSSINIPLNTLGFRMARAFSPLICSEGGSAGKKISFIKQNTYFGNKLFAINEYFPLAEKFIFFNYQSINFQKSFQLKMTGIIGGISLANFQQILIPLPPLEEQKRIIKKIEELFALCESLSQQVNASQEKQSDLLKAVMLKIQEV